jgi:hypothetical protein
MGYENVAHAQHALKQLQSLTQEVVSGAVAAVAAQGTLTITDGQNAGDGETVTIDGVVYTFQTTLTEVANNVLIGADDEESCANLAAAINRGAGYGTAYAALTAAHPSVTAAQATNTCVVTAKAKGINGNQIPLLEGMAQGAWDAPRMGTTTAGAGDIQVAGLEVGDALESVLQVDGTSGVPTAELGGEASIAAAVKATGTLTIVNGQNAVADETVTIGTTVYTWKAAPSAANEIDIGTDDDESCANLAAAINGGAGEGTAYGTGTVAHADVVAYPGTNIVDLVAKEGGAAGNDIATTETMTQGSFAAATLVGGASGAVQLSSTDASADKLVVRWLPKVSRL